MTNESPYGALWNRLYTFAGRIDDDRAGSLSDDLSIIGGLVDSLAEELADAIEAIDAWRQTAPRSTERADARQEIETVLSDARASLANLVPLLTQDRKDW